MDVKISKNKHISRRFSERTSSMLDEIEWKTLHKDKGDQYRKKTEWSKASQKYNNPQNLLDIHPMQKEVPPSHKLQDHAYE